MERNGMFDNVGNKIETFAKVCLFICIGFAVLILLGACVSSSNSYYNSGAIFITSLISAIVLVIVGYIGSFMIYGYGKLIENVDDIKNMLKEMNKNE